jgi:glyoxylase-like metal-dependent hydrolase (beta-lactamase superfamily II)
VNVTEVPNTWDARVRMFSAGDPKNSEVDCFVVITDRYVVVIDTFSTPEDAAQMMELVRPELEPSTIPARQLLVVNTHQHYDHVWGNSLFAMGGEFAAPILASELSREVARNQAVKLLEKQAEETRFANLQLLEPNLYFQNEFLIDGGDLSLRLIPAPGHTPDQVVVWIPELSILLAADALEFPFPYVANPTDLPVLLETMRNLKSLNPKTILPCHGGVHDASLIDQNLAYFAALEFHVRNALPRLGTGQHDPENESENKAEHLGDLVGFSFEAAIKNLGLEPESIDDFYRGFHRSNLKATLKNLLG